MSRRARRSLVLGWCLTLILVACGRHSGDEETVTVFAAASLTGAFEALADSFEAGHPGLVIELNFASSSSLRQQVLEGAPADVFASADTPNMEQLVQEGAASAPSVLVTNVLQIAVPAGNPASIGGLGDFSRSALLIGLCAEGIPCGDYARQVLSQAGIVPAVDTNEPDVRALLVKIEAGELDAGIVYASDVRSGGDRIEGVEIDPDVNVVASYPIAALTDAQNPGGAGEFVRFSLSPEGQAILESHGFLPP